jgi:hypothetical protein
MVLAMPLLVLFLLFLMTSEVKRPPVLVNIALHLATLFVVAMVCHGELARDRPDVGHLTEYFLWMSVGGVVGGLFNALVAPLVFNAIVEYPLAMVVACLLLPSLAAGKETTWGRRVDVLLALMFLGVGGLLIFLRSLDRNLSFQSLTRGPWQWELAALVLGLALGAGAVFRGPKEERTDRWLDLILPAALGILVLGLTWGLSSTKVEPRIERIAELLHVKSDLLTVLLMLGLPAVLCYTFVERSLRLGLGLGAILLAYAVAVGGSERLVFQKRSFFGVLKVQNGIRYDRDRDRLLPYRELIHGTTLHGMQFLDEGRRDEPLTYYHRTGPIGQVFAAYNTDPKRPYAVIGLGTGTMACYALPEQDVTFFDIDPVVRDISFKEDDPYFTYVQEARKRGAKLNLVLGDARVEMERLKLKEEEKYRLLVVDAFSSDAIPIHLITLEALKVYLDHMADDGIVCFHISNRYLDLRPVLANLGRELGLASLYESDDEERQPGKSRSTWVVLARKPEYLAKLRNQPSWSRKDRDLTLEVMNALALWPDGGTQLSSLATLLERAAIDNLPLATWRPLEQASDERDWPDADKVGVWTDDYSNLLSVFGF